MKYRLIDHFRRKQFFTVEDTARYLSIAVPSARVLCSRYTARGLLVRLKNNFYTTAENWNNSQAPQHYTVSNYLQTPSYLSFNTALAYHGVTTQVPRDYFESAALKRSAEYTVRGVTFRYIKLKKEQYFGFSKVNGFFIATKEKAFLDALYMSSLGRYSLDFSALDTGKLDWKAVSRMAGYFPKKVRLLAEKYART